MLTREQFRERFEGTIIAQEILEELRPVVQGAYLIQAFGRHDLIAEIDQGLNGRDTL